MSDNRRGNLLYLPDCILSDVNKPFAKFWGSQVNLVSSKPMSFGGEFYTQVRRNVYCF